MLELVERVESLLSAKRLQRLVDERGWSRREVARRLGAKDPTWVNRLFQRDTRIKRATLLRLAAVFELPPEALLGGETETAVAGVQRQVGVPGDQAAVVAIYGTIGMPVEGFGDTGGRVNLPALDLYGAERPVAVQATQDYPEFGVRAGEFVIVDLAARQPADGAPCVIDWDGTIRLARWPAVGTLLGEAVSAGRFRRLR